MTTGGSTGAGFCRISAVTSAGGSAAEEEECISGWEVEEDELPGGGGCFRSGVHHQPGGGVEPQVEEETPSP